MRIDSDVTDALKAKTSKKAEKEMAEQAESLGNLMKKALKKDKLNVTIQKLKNKKVFLQESQSYLVEAARI